MQSKNLLSLLQKRFLATSATLSTTASSTSPTTPPFAVQFLVNSCGLPWELALAASKTLKLDHINAQNPQSVLSLLKSHKFDDTQIANLISKRPSLLKSRLHSNLRPKLQFLLENGFSGELLPKLIMSNPDILGRSLVSQIKPAYEILKKFLITHERVVASVNRASWLLTSDPKSKLLPNMELLMREGVPDKTVTQLLLSQPRTLMLKVERMVACMETVKELGLQPSSPMFTAAVRVKSTMSDSTWNKKVEAFKDLGWSEEDIFNAFIRCPNSLAYSEEKIRRAMDFYMKTMKMELEDIISSPKLLSFSIETRIRPRYQVLKVLVSKGLVKHDNKPRFVFEQSETRFLDNFVFKYVGEIPTLLEMYIAAKAKAI